MTLAHRKRVKICARTCQITKHVTVDSKCSKTFSRQPNNQAIEKFGITSQTGSIPMWSMECHNEPTWCGGVPQYVSISPTKQSQIERFASQSCSQPLQQPKFSMVCKIKARSCEGPKTKLGSKTSTNNVTNELILELLMKPHK